MTGSFQPRYQKNLSRGFVLASSVVLLMVSFRWPTVPKITALGPYGGDVRSLNVHPKRPNTVFLGTADGQIYRSEDAGENWIQLKPGLGRRDLVVDNLAFDPRDPNTLYAAAWELKNDRGWLFRTRNGGRTWENVPLGRFQGAIRALAVAPSDPDVMAVGITRGVLLSENGGRTWERITRGFRSLYYVESLTFDPVNSQTLYVGTWHLGWKTENRGGKWQPIHRGMVDDSDLFSLLVDPRDPQVLYSSACTGIYKTKNKGARWKPLKKGLPKKARRTRALALDPSDPDTVYAGTTQGVFVSANGGDQWRQILSNVVVNAVTVHPDDRNILLVGTDDAGVLKSDDAGRTFHPANRGFIHRQISALAMEPEDSTTLYAGISRDGEFGGFFSTTNRGVVWRSHNEGLDLAGLEIKAILPSMRSSDVYLATSHGLFRGVPAHTAWLPVEPTQGMSIVDAAFADEKEEELFVAVSSGVGRLRGGRQELEPLEMPEPEIQITVISYLPQSELLLVGTEKGLFRSRNGGRSWERTVDGLPQSPIRALQNRGERIFCGTRSGLFQSRDGGKSWTRCQGVYPLDIVAIGWNSTLPIGIYAADTSGHLFHSRDDGDNWEAIALGNSHSSLAHLVLTPQGDLLAGTVSEGVYRLIREGVAAGL